MALPAPDAVARWVAEGRPGGFLAIVVQPPDAAGPHACRHRSARWNCNAEVITSCALGHGQAGVIEPQDCESCPDRAAPA